MSVRDHGPTCITSQNVSPGPRSHPYRRSEYQSGTTVPPVSPVRISAWAHSPTHITGQNISTLWITVFSLCDRRRTARQLYTVDVLIETQGEVYALPLPCDAAEQVFPSVRFHVRERI